jgi:hypothetical protein
MSCVCCFMRAHQHTTFFADANQGHMTLRWGRKDVQRSVTTLLPRAAVRGVCRRRRQPAKHHKLVLTLCAADSAPRGLRSSLPLQLRHGSAARRAARRRGAHSARSCPPRPCPAHPHSSASAAPHTARCDTAKHVGARPGPHDRAERRVALRRSACPARSSPPRPAAALPHTSDAPTAPLTALRRSASHDGSTLEPHGGAARRVSRRRCACVARSCSPHQRPARPHSSAPTAPRTARRDTAKHASAPPNLMAAGCDVRRGGAAPALRAAARRTRSSHAQQATPLQRA